MSAAAALQLGHARAEELHISSQERKGPRIDREKDQKDIGPRMSAKRNWMRHNYPGTAPHHSLRERVGETAPPFIDPSSRA